MLAVFLTISAASNERYAMHDDATLSTSLGLPGEFTVDWPQRNDR